MEAREDTDVNAKVNGGALDPVSPIPPSAKRRERARGHSGEESGAGQGSAAELSPPGRVSAACGVFGAGREGGEGGRFTGCSLGRQRALIPAGLGVWRHRDGDAESSRVGSGAPGVGCGLAPRGWEQHWRGRRVFYTSCWRDKGELGSSELVQRGGKKHLIEGNVGFSIN